jgi:hypothetical protein
MTWCYGYLALLTNIDINMVLVQYLFLQPYGCSFPDWLVWLLLRAGKIDIGRPRDSQQVAFLTAHNNRNDFLFLL